MTKSPKVSLSPLFGKSVKSWVLPPKMYHLPYVGTMGTKTLRATPLHPLYPLCPLYPPIENFTPLKLHFSAIAGFFRVIHRDRDIFMGTKTLAILVVNLWGQRHWFMGTKTFLWGQRH